MNIVFYVLAGAVIILLFVACSKGFYKFGELIEKIYNYFKNNIKGDKYEK